MFCLPISPPAGGTFPSSPLPSRSGARNSPPLPYPPGALHSRALPAAAPRCPPTLLHARLPRLGERTYASLLLSIRWEQAHQVPERKPHVHVPLIPQRCEPTRQKHQSAVTVKHNTVRSCRYLMLNWATTSASENFEFLVTPCVATTHRCATSTDTLWPIADCSSGVSVGQVGLAMPLT